MIEQKAAPLISVILPVYNGEQYLAEAMDSLLAQTFSDFELIAFDDGSTDRSLKILKRYAEQDRRVRVISRENRGLVTTLNESINEARGTWVARMDQDDIALPQRFERQLSWLEKTDADISGSWVQRFGTSDKRVVRLRETDQAIKMEMLFCSPFAHPAVMIRTSTARKLRYDIAFEKAEDYDLWERSAEAGCKMTNVQEILLLYRMHPAQISTLTAIKQQLVEQAVRRRYWEYIAKEEKLEQSCVYETLKLFEPTMAKIDMRKVGQVFGTLFRQGNDEAKSVILDRVRRLYLTAAASCPDIVSQWNDLSREMKVEVNMAFILKLWIFHTLKIKSNGYMFRQIKKIYIWGASR
jgi:glycosyltransferase involved in cell wall biosynthesis